MSGTWATCMRFLTIALFALSAAALAVPSASACRAANEGFVHLASPEAEIAYRLQADQLKVGQFFAVEVVVCRTPGTDAVRAVLVDAQMPAHGHGMNYRPTMTEIEPGHFRVSGLMLHMPGKWRMTFDLLQGDRHIRLTQEMNLKP